MLSLPPSRFRCLFLRAPPRALPFPSWGRLSENIPPEPRPRKRKGEVFTLGLTYPWQPADKEEPDSRSGRSPTPEGEVLRDFSESLGAEASGWRFAGETHVRTVDLRTRRSLTEVFGCMWLAPQDEQIWKIAMFLKRMDTLPPTVDAEWKKVPSVAATQPPK